MKGEVIISPGYLNMFQQKDIIFFVLDIPTESTVDQPNPQLIIPPSPERLAPQAKLAPSSSETESETETESESDTGRAGRHTATLDAGKDKITDTLQQVELLVLIVYTKCLVNIEKGILLKANLKCRSI